MLHHNTTKLSDIKNVVRYILHYAEDHTVLLPCRIPGYNRDDIQILPSSTTKQEVWQLYHSTASAGADMKAVGYSLVFYSLFGYSFSHLHFYFCRVKSCLRIPTIS